VGSVQQLLQEGGAAPELLTTLKQQGQQFLWGGRECDEARRLQQQLLEVEDWVKQVGTDSGPLSVLCLARCMRAVSVSPCSVSLGVCFSLLFRAVFISKPLLSLVSPCCINRGPVAGFIAPIAASPATFKHITSHLPLLMTPTTPTHTNRLRLQPGTSRGRPMTQSRGCCPAHLTQWQPQALKTSRKQQQQQRHGAQSTTQQ
jgi:hypothetical protein